MDRYTPIRRIWSAKPRRRQGGAVPTGALGGGAELDAGWRCWTDPAASAAADRK
jgi:hypothetical protein